MQCPTIDHIEFSQRSQDAIEEIRKSKDSRCHYNASLSVGLSSYLRGEQLSTVLLRDHFHRLRSSYKSSGRDTFNGATTHL